MDETIDTVSQLSRATYFLSDCASSFFSSSFGWIAVQT
jgi:hypothetical protein